jgi:hypothetical protein
MRQNPQLVPAYIDMAEHTADLTTHRALNPRIDRLTSILQSIKDTNLLLGADILHNSQAYHRSLREAAKVNAVGASSIYADLKRQFPGPGHKTSPVAEKEQDEVINKGKERGDLPNYLNGKSKLPRMSPKTKERENVTKVIEN